jgi:hypothetical protein
MSVVWTVTMAAKIPTEKLARVSAYDGLGTTMGMPVGALVAGPLAASIGVAGAQYGAAAIMVIASALTLIPREIRTMRADSIEPVLVDLTPAEPAPLLAAEPVLAAEPSLAAQRAY